MKTQELKCASLTTEHVLDKEQGSVSLSNALYHHVSILKFAGLQPTVGTKPVNLMLDSVNVVNENVVLTIKTHRELDTK